MFPGIKKYILLILCIPTSVLSQSLPAVFSAKPYIQASYDRDNLDNGYQNWQSSTYSITLPIKELGLVYGEISDSHRFEDQNQSVYLSYAKPLSLGVISIEGGHSDNASFLAKNILGTHWQGYLGNGFLYSLQYRQKRFINSDSQLYGLGLEKYFKNFRLAYQAQYGTLNQNNGEWANKLQFQVIENDYRIGVSYVRGREPQTTGLNTVAVSDIETFQLDGLINFGSYALVTGLWKAHQGSNYTRKGGQLGLRIYF